MAALNDPKFDLILYASGVYSLSLRCNCANHLTNFFNNDSKMFPHELNFRKYT